MKIHHVFDRGDHYCVYADEFYGESVQKGNEEVEAYLAEHPEALVEEPVPEPPSPAELLRAEEAQLLAYLAETRYHVDIAFETGVALWPDLKVARADARARLAEIARARQAAAQEA